MIEVVNSDDTTVNIPVFPFVESLNMAIAPTVILL